MIVYATPGRLLETAGNMRAMGGAHVLIADTDVDVPATLGRAGLLRAVAEAPGRGLNPPQQTPTGPSGWWTAQTGQGILAPHGQATVYVWEPRRATLPDDLYLAAVGARLPDDPHPRALDGPGAVRAAEWWLSAVGRHYHGNAGLSCLDKLRETLGMERTPARHAERPEAVPSLGDLHWRQGRPQPRGTTLAQWDMRAAYLAAASAVTLGWGAPRSTGANPPDDAAGWFRVILPPARTVAHVPVVDTVHIRRDGTAWVTHPILAYLRQLNPTGVEIVDSFTSKTAGRLLRPWAESWRDLLFARVDPINLRTLFKIGYTSAIGLLGRPGGSIYRPDWHDAIKAQARVSMLRRIKRVADTMSTLPRIVRVDAVTYALPDESASEALGDLLGVGERMGNMRRIAP